MCRARPIAAERLWSPLLQCLGEADVNELATLESIGTVGPGVVVSCSKAVGSKSHSTIFHGIFSGSLYSFVPCTGRRTLFRAAGKAPCRDAQSTVVVAPDVAPIVTLLTQLGLEASV